jgi:ureidoacrylate peracid hydrolase
MTTMSRTVTIGAQPGPVTSDPARTAVLVVDMQNDFGAEGGMFHRVGIDISPIRRAVASTRAVLRAARRAGIKVIYLRWSTARISRTPGRRTPHRIKHLPLAVGEPVPTPDGEGRILIRDTWNKR